MRRSRNRHTDIDATAERLVDLLWTTLQPPAPERAALVRLKDEVVEAIRRFDDAADENKPQVNVKRSPKKQKASA